MIRLSVNSSKKVPIPNQDFSSQQFGCALEIEVGDTDSAESIQGRIKNLYTLISTAIDEQIAAASAPQGQPVQAPVAAPAAAPVNRIGQATVQPPVNRVSLPAHQNGNGNGNGNGGRRPMKTATVAQQRAIFAISKALGLDLLTILADYQVVDPRDLTVRDASTLIDSLKQQQGAGQQQ